LSADDGSALLDFSHDIFCDIPGGAGSDINFEDLLGVGVLADQMRSMTLSSENIPNFKMQGGKLPELPSKLGATRH
jgi:hypothetical protein